MKTSSRTRDRGQPSGNGARPPNESSYASETLGDLYGQNTSEDRHGSRGQRREATRAQNHDTTSPRSGASPNSSPNSRPSQVPSSPSSSSTSSSRSSAAKGSSRSSTRDTAGTSPAPSIRSGAAGTALDTASKHFPLANIDYETSPAAVAQELSNLQALRRMSMEASAATDPDLPGFSFSALTPPTGADDDQDARRLFWVPARLHPEIAPEGWKAFVEARVKEIRSPSGQSSLLSPDGGSGHPGLRRKKSMLSRQIDNTGGRAAEGYEDGAERLERRRSTNGTTMLKVSDLENLVNDPSSLLRKLSVNPGSRPDANGKMDEDLPILPAQLGHTLRRSTRTTYRKDRGSGLGGLGSGRGKRFNKADTDTEDNSPANSPGSPRIDMRLQRVQTEPALSTHGEGISVPGKIRGTPEPVESNESFNTSSRHKTIGKLVEGAQSPSSSFEDMLSNSANVPPSQQSPTTTPKQSGSKSSRRSTSPTRSAPATSHVRKESQDKSMIVPRIVETPPPETSQKHPERSSSNQPPAAAAKISKKSPKQQQQEKAATAAIEAPRPASAGRDSLSPSPNQEKRAGRSDSVGSSSRKSSWGWLRGDSGGDGKDKEQKERDAQKAAGEREKDGKPRKLKSNKPDKDKDKEHARLDVIQKSIDGKETTAQGENGSVKTKDGDAKKKDASSSDAASGAKKEKDSGIFSTLFGGSRKKSNSDHKKAAARVTSPERAQPQQNFYYTRFPIHIERAIYRLSHLKLANPRRPLLQQVLLSNFMYSYLAKVQMHQPTLLQQQAAAAQQQQQQQQQQQLEQQRQLEYEQQQQAYQQQQQQAYEQQQQQMYDSQGEQQYYNYDDGNHVDYAEDSQMYEYDDDHQYQQHHEDDGGHHGHMNGHGGGGGGGNGGSGGGGGRYDQQQYHQQYYSPSQQHQQQQQQRGQRSEEMW